MVRVIIGHGALLCDVAQTSKRRARGLLDHVRLDVNEGLLLAFEREGRVPITTVGMRFPIDLVFVGQDSRVHAIVDRLPPGVMQIERVARFVIEAPADWCRARGVMVGDRVFVA